LLFALLHSKATKAARRIGRTRCDRDDTPSRTPRRYD
jgi:hypothetical protein